MATVIKRNKHRQKFSQQKLSRSIERAAREAGVSKNERKVFAREISAGIAKIVHKKRSVRSTQIRRMALRRLESRSKASVGAWQRHDRKHKKIR